MAEEPDNLVLRMLPQVDGKLDTLMDRVHDLTARVASVEDQLVAMRADTSALRGDFVRLEYRMDNSTNGSGASSAGSISSRREDSEINNNG